MKDSSSTIEWLLEEDQPCMRYLTLTQLLGRGEKDPEVESAREQIASKGWAAEILTKRDSSCGWSSDQKLYKSKFYGTHWMLLILSDLGLTKSDLGMSAACEEWISRLAKPDGGFGFENGKKSHLCIVGNTTRALIKFGYDSHPKVRSSLNWLVENQSERGGWSCFGGGRNLDSWEGLSAFAEYPRQKWTRGMKLAVEMGAEFYLDAELHRQGARYEPWYRFHYPVHYFYDLLVGLDFMTSLGYLDDKRLNHAISVLEQKRKPDGRWNLDAVHPDVDGSIKKYYLQNPKEAPEPFALERSGAPSKMITFRALRILSRLGRTN